MRFAAVILFVLASFSCEAAHWYLRSGAAGLNDGSDWVNAWHDSDHVNWAGMAAGDSLWIAGGVYGHMTITKNGTAANPIYIARVRTTNTVPVSATGWNAAYDDTVFINHFDAGASHWILDGQIPNSGLVITNTTFTGAGDLVVCDYTVIPLTNLTYKNLKITAGVIDNNPAAANYFSNAFPISFYTIDCNTSGNQPFDTVNISYVSMEETMTCMLILGWNNVTIDHSKFWRNWATNCPGHCNLISAVACTNLTFRYSEFTQYYGLGFLMCFTAGNDPNDTWTVHNSLFHNAFYLPTSRVMEAQYVPQYRVSFLNNTTVNIDSGISTAHSGSWDSTCTSSNNISFTTNAAPTQFGGGNDDYNLGNQVMAGANSISGSTSAIFKNPAALDYSIVSTIGATFPRDKGLNLGTAFAIDFTGYTRSGTWDIGAYEYQEPTRASTAISANVGTITRP